MPLLTLIALPFIGSVIAALLPTNARNAASGWAGLIALIAFAQALLLISDMLDGSVLREQWQWLPSAGLDFVVRVDGFAWMFSLLVLGIGLLVVLYARYYMSRDDPVARFFSFFLAFMGSMQGETHLTVYPLRWIGFGFIAAVLTGLGALAFGFPFLTTHTAHLHLPGIGEVHLASALLFDIGIFAVVFGSTLLILIALAHQSLRAARRPGDDEGS